MIVVSSSALYVVAVSNLITLYSCFLTFDDVSGSTLSYSTYREMSTYLLRNHYAAHFALLAVLNYRIYADS